MKSIIPLILVSLIISCANEEHTNKQDQINNKNEETVNPLKRIDSLQNIIDSNQREKRNTLLKDSIKKANLNNQVKHDISEDILLNGYKEVTRKSIEEKLELPDNSTHIDGMGRTISYDRFEEDFHGAIGFYNKGSLAFISWNQTFNHFSIENDYSISDNDLDSIVVKHIAKENILPLVYSTEDPKLNDSIEIQFKYYQKDDNYKVHLCFTNETENKSYIIDQWDLNQEGPMYENIPKINQIHISPMGNVSVEISTYSFGEDMVGHAEFYSFGIIDVLEHKIDIDISKVEFMLHEDYNKYIDEFFKDEPQKLKLLRALTDDPLNDSLKRELVNIYH